MTGTLLGCKDSEQSTAITKQHRAILYFDGEQKLQMDYEGTGYRQSSTHGAETVEFKAMHLNQSMDQDIQNEKWVDASFRGTFITSGENPVHVRISLKLDNQVPFEIQTLGITAKGSPRSDEPVSYQFSPGQHEVIIEGDITGIYDKKSSM